MAEAPGSGRDYAARDRRRGAQPADADQGLRSFGALEARRAAPDHGGGRASASGIAGGRLKGGTMGRFAAVVLALIPVLALGQAYPNKPVRMIIPFAPGGANG